ncbi:MAG: nucleotide sugar dehydrogenase, partial [Patescibacteria group bacterium]
MNLTIIGAGYVGLITAVVFAHLGNKVWVVEIDKNKFEKLSKGEVPFYEQGIAELLQENLASGQIKFTSGYSTAIPEAEIIFICVGTPTKNGRADLTYVYTAAKEIAKNLRAPSIVVIKSTVPPGINHKIEAKMKKLTRVDFEIASVPEFLREGRALHDALHPHRVVIGTQNKKVAKKLLELHRKIPGKRIVC